ncbi:hypothetical protein CDD82_3708 [Ophiocordyceps australis]|uniref:Uncharacterized protein n=1 Tax=Ophiocordyceps australis TaxID=1399860 RepID=A0A2C5ZT96_9HYPO|nr:hypothetical protein CDD82_3708 [Ophiocordyceps australis]
MTMFFSPLGCREDKEKLDGGCGSVLQAPLPAGKALAQGAVANTAGGGSLGQGDDDDGLTSLSVNAQFVTRVELSQSNTLLIHDDVDSRLSSTLQLPRQPGRLCCTEDAEHTETAHRDGVQRRSTETEHKDGVQIRSTDTEYGGQRTEDRGQRPEARGQRPEDTVQRPEYRVHRPEYTGQSRRLVVSTAISLPQLPRRAIKSKLQVECRYMHAAIGTWPPSCRQAASTVGPCVVGPPSPRQCAMLQCAMCVGLGVVLDSSAPDKEAKEEKELKEKKRVATPGCRTKMTRAKKTHAHILVEWLAVSSQARKKGSQSYNQHVSGGQGHRHVQAPAAIAWRL